MLLDFDDDDQDLGIDPIHMEKILKSNIILKIRVMTFWELEAGLGSWILELDLGAGFERWILEVDL